MRLDQEVTAKDVIAVSLQGFQTLSLNDIVPGIMSPNIGQVTLAHPTRNSRKAPDRHTATSAAPCPELTEPRPR